MTKSPLTYEDAVRKGDMLLKAMRGSASEATLILGFESQSSFLSFPNDLSSSGWITYPEAPKKTDYRGLELGMKAFNLSKENNMQIEWRQDIASETFGATEAYFDNIYNVSDQAILANGTLSPASIKANTFHAASMTLPPLQNWSDVTFLQWCELTGGNPGALKFLWRVNIFNAETYSIVKEALKRKYNEEPSTLGRLFSVEDEEGKAVLGTVHGAGVVYLLAQHKQQMGVKTVRGVYVFQSPEKDNERRVLVRGLGPVLGLQLVFIIENADENEESMDFRKGFEAAVG